MLIMHNGIYWIIKAILQTVSQVNHLVIFNKVVKIETVLWKQCQMGLF